MESYKTILNRGYFEYEDRKSVFIGECMSVTTEAEALSFIESVRKKYSDARHHVYAYVLRDNSIMRFSDDHEPQGTAGLPVLDSLRRNGVVDAVVVVTRYFGGTLLGTGGLVRAYSAAAFGAVENAKIITYDVYRELKITVGYSDYQRLSPLFEEYSFRIQDTVFTDSVEISGTISVAQADAITKKIVESTSGRAKIEQIGEKFDF